MVLGESGSGKSEFLRQIAQQISEPQRPIPLLLDYADIAKPLAAGKVTEAICDRLAPLSQDAPTEFTALLNDDPSQTIVFIDAFDEINVSLHVDDPNPTPQSLYPLLEAQLRVVVAARRSLAASPEAFARAFAGADSPLASDDPWYKILELSPCDLSDVYSALDKLPARQATVIREYLSHDTDIKMSRVRRPLFLRMLMNLPSEDLENGNTFSMYDLYDRFVNVVLDRDVDANRTAMPRDAKRQILREVAYDMFSAQVASETRPTPDTVRARVNAVVAASQSEDWAQAPKYRWYDDFTRTNHLIVEERSALTRDVREVVFVHQSIFEFFLTRHFAVHFEEFGRFGLLDNHHSIRAFDSLLPYFLRSQFGISTHPGLEERLVQLVKDAATSNRDRLLGLFFLEDSQQILELLRYVGPNYTRFLQDAAQEFDSFFMAKVVRYQLALLDSGIGQSLAYVCDLRLTETEENHDMEVHAVAADERPTDFLLMRLTNVHLTNALPITIYRLGQFGTAEAIDPIHKRIAQLKEPVDPCLLALVEEAVNSIEHREIDTVTTS